jgi:hypothetical protein
MELLSLLLFELDSSPRRWRVAPGATIDPAGWTDTRNDVVWGVDGLIDIAEPPVRPMPRLH